MFTRFRVHVLNLLTMQNFYGRAYLIEVAFLARLYGNDVSRVEVLHSSVHGHNSNELDAHDFLNWALTPELSRAAARLGVMVNATT